MCFHFIAYWFILKMKWPNSSAPFHSKDKLLPHIWYITTLNILHNYHQSPYKSVYLLSIISHLSNRIPSCKSRSRKGKTKHELSFYTLSLVSLLNFSLFYFSWSSLTILNLVTFIFQMYTLYCLMYCGFYTFRNFYRWYEVVVFIDHCPSSLLLRGWGW